MVDQQPSIIGLTGPLAAGKDTVAKILQKQGAYIINVDQLAHALYVSQSPVWRELLITFGSKILNRGGSVNRKKLGNVVFADRDKLAALNHIVHPYLKDAVIMEIERLRQEENTPSILVVNAALLEEIGLTPLVDEVWVVIASQANRLKRLLRKNLGKKAASLRMRTQKGQKAYLALADVVIRNNGTLKSLEKQVCVLLSHGKI
jgi:dephospho-CoA kinase